MPEPSDTWVEPGRVLVEEGRVSPVAYVVLEGRATVSYGGRAIATLGPGARIGAAGAGSGAPRLVTVTAASRMHLEVWPDEHLAPWALGRVATPAPSDQRSLRTRGGQVTQ
jgi:CRP-like cAMP-binding protein